MNPSVGKGVSLKGGALPKTAILAAAILLAGCAMSPGYYWDESKLQDRAQARQAAAADPKFEVTSITAAMIAQLNAAAPLRNAALDDHLLTAREQDYHYIIEPDDVLSITVFNHPELSPSPDGAGAAGFSSTLATASGSATPASGSSSSGQAGYLVNRDGTFNYPFIGKVTAAGATVNQIRKHLELQLTPYIRNPQIFVKVADFRSQKVSIAGEVKKPGVLPVSDQPMTAERAIQLAEGATPEADLHNVTLLRAGRVYKLDLQDLYERGDVGQNTLLRNGDTLNVPDRSQNKIYVLGEVGKSGALQMNKGRMTLAEALGDSNGFSNGSNPSKIYVLRGDMGKPTIYRLNGRSPDAMLLASQFQLQPKDVVYVSPAEITRWNRAIGEIMPSLTGVLLGTQLK